MNIKSLSQFVVFSNLWVSVAATSAYSITLIQLQTDITGNIHNLIFVFISTFFIYNFQRLWRINAQADLKNYRLQWIKKYKNPLIVSCSAAAVLIFYYFTGFKPLTQLLIVLAGTASILYVLPFIPSNGKVRMLRELPFFKIFVVSIVWVVLTVMFPVMEFNSKINGQMLNILLIGLERFVFIFAITLPFDIRDFKYDKRDEVVTFITAFGVKTSKRLSYALLGILCFLAVMRILFFQLPFSQGLALMISYLFTYLIVRKSNEEMPELFYSGLVESTVLIQLLLLLPFN